MQAMIFAAGLGTRLKPLTDKLPKALIEVGGEPLLERVIEKLKASGVGKIVINVHHFSEKIIAYLKENQYFNTDILISDESGELLDTGGGLKKAAPLFNPDEDILIHNVDILSNINITDFYNYGCGDDALLLVSERKTKRYLLFNDEMRLMGWTNIETGEIKSPYLNIKDMNCRKFAFAGIHKFSPRLFKLMDAWPEKFGITDFYINSCAEANIRGYVKNDLQIMDVGKLSTLGQAEEFIKFKDKE